MKAIALIVLGCFALALAGDCMSCNGTGSKIENGEIVKCMRCGGSGNYETPFQMGYSSGEEKGKQLQSAINETEAQRQQVYRNIAEIAKTDSAYAEKLLKDQKETEAVAGTILLVILGALVIGSVAVASN